VRERAGREVDDAHTTVAAVELVAAARGQHDVLDRFEAPSLHTQSEGSVDREQHRGGRVRVETDATEACDGEHAIGPEVDGRHAGR
jgi:hypothetical protein